VCGTLITRSVVSVLYLLGILAAGAAPWTAAALAARRGALLPLNALGDDGDAFCDNPNQYHCCRLQNV